MARASTSIGLLALCMTACASTPLAVPAGPNRAAMARVTVMAAAQVKRCYRSAGGGAAARRITTVLAVRYGPDGNLTGLPQLVRQTGVVPGNAVLARRVAEAASLAVIRCQPLRLPAELYQGGWDDMELTFSAGMAA